jgi:hypothetical protein
VARLCEEIAGSEGASREDVALAWLLGMFHDIGRFEQLRRYGTFVDAQSVDHANLSADILFVEGKVRDYFPEYAPEDASQCRYPDWKLVELAIRSHSLYRLPEDLNDRELFFCQVLRDADKIDIFRVNIDTAPEDIYNVTTYDLKNSEVSPGVLESFTGQHATLREKRKTAIDYLAAHISLTYELVYPRSRQLAMEQGYLDKMLAFESDNPKTREQFAWMGEKIREFCKGDV